MVIHRLTNQTVGSETYLQKTTYEGKKMEGNHKQDQMLEEKLSSAERGPRQSLSSS